jgi:hypothetical protein
MLDTSRSDGLPSLRWRKDEPAFGGGYSDCLLTEERHEAHTTARGRH